MNSGPFALVQSTERSSGTVRSPVAAFESGLPSVRRKDLEHAIFLDPPLYPKIVFYRMVPMFLPFFGRIHSDGFPAG